MPWFISSMIVSPASPMVEGVGEALTYVSFQLPMEQSDDVEVALIRLLVARSSRSLGLTDGRVLDEAVSRAALTGKPLLLKPWNGEVDLDFGGMQM